MKPTVNLDLDLLRTFVLGLELGSFARAAHRVGRSQSAISTQLRRLEEQVGRQLVRREGRGLVPTEAGHTMLRYARRMLDLNDEAVAALRDTGDEGRIRLGLPQDFAGAGLPDIVRRFAEAYPLVEIEVHCETVTALVAKAIRGDLDLTLAWGPVSVPNATQIATLPTEWIARPGWTAQSGVVPLVAFEAPCAFREAAITALDRAGIAWRIACTSPSLAGLWDAVGVGLGVTARTRIGLPDGLSTFRPGKVGLPDLPAVALSLVHAGQPRDRKIATLEEIVRDAIKTQVAAAVPALPDNRPADLPGANPAHEDGVGLEA